MQMHLLPVSHALQDNEFGCLAACAHMVLRFYGISVSQTELNRLFELRTGGVPFSNLSRAARYGVRISLWEGDENLLRKSIEQGHPAIVFVNTEQLTSYWDTATWHAIVVVGYDDEHFYVNDPAFPNAPITVPIDEFMLAWLEYDYTYALIS